MCKDNRNVIFIFQVALANLRNFFFLMRLHPASKMLVNRNCVLPLKKRAVKYKLSYRAIWLLGAQISGLF